MVHESGRIRTRTRPCDACTPLYLLLHKLAPVSDSFVRDAPGNFLACTKTWPSRAVNQRIPRTRRPKIIASHDDLKNAIPMCGTAQKECGQKTAGKSFDTDLHM
jgi:hypothetical protein